MDQTRRNFLKLAVLLPTVAVKVLSDPMKTKTVPIRKQFHKISIYGEDGGYLVPPELVKELTKAFRQGNKGNIVFGDPLL